MDGSKKSGFTLIELLVACVIVAILGAVGSVYFVGVVEKAHMSEANTVLGVLKKAQIVYYDEYSNVSPSLDDLSIGFTELKYFTDTNVSDASWDGAVAKVRRKNNFRFGCYTLSIDRRGIVNCTPDGGKPCPALD